LANPGGIVLDLEALAEVAKRHGVPLVVDNTLASPYLCRPFDFGADLVLHSTTKFIGGHGNTMGGMVVESGRFDWWQNDKFPSMTQPDPAYHGLTFAETFGDFGFTMKMRAVALRDYGPCIAVRGGGRVDDEAPRVADIGEVREHVHLVDHREAGARAGDRRADLDLGRVVAGLEVEPRVARFRDRAHAPQIGHDSGKHPSAKPLGVRAGR
jgi:hypothetical protein